ncbi:hypothetical protein MMC07_008808, partial [Pseudocyphellaria aurata]|nr:hypothetical protein [Pseudocyphellaria aurata]
MLGVLRMDIDSCISAYLKMAPNIFSVKNMLADSKLSRIKKVLTGDPRFSPIPLEEAIKGLVVEQLKERATEGENTPMRFEPEPPCKVFVCVTSEALRKHFRFRSYESPTGVRDDCPIWQACRATSAAPTFFPPMMIGNPSAAYVDGGLGYNNPIRALMEETRLLWPRRSIGCIVSIGTGKALPKDVGRSIKPLLKTLASISTDTEKVAREFREEMAEQEGYFRFNVQQGMEKISLEEWREFGKIKVATEDYLDEHHRQEHALNRFQMTSSKPYWSVPFDKNPGFVGRASQLGELEAKLFKQPYQCTKFAIFGLGGVGKTQVALELAYRMRDTYPECAIFWLPATNTESLQQAYMEIGRQLQIPGLDDKQADIQKLVQLHLSQENASQWLLIFDNADDIDMWFKPPEKAIESAGLIDCLPRHNKGSIVFTTRSRKIAVKLARQNVIEVAEMDEDHATEVLTKSLTNQNKEILLNDRQSLLSLLNQLTFLPLAIVQAAAYINENGTTLKEYLALFDDTEQNIIEILAEDFEEEGRYRDAKNPVATTWLISYEQIRHRDPLAAEYLSFMSCVDPKAVPQSLLPQAPSKKKRTDAIGTLSAYSFITKRSDDQALDLHRLVHLTTRNWLRQENTLSVWTSRTVALLDKVFPSHQPQNRNIWRAYLPHVRYILESELVGNDLENRLELLEKFALCLLSDGRYDEAEGPFEQ